MARFSIPTWLFLGLLMGCEDCQSSKDGDSNNIGSDSGDDDDGDGYTVGDGDCDDSDPDSHPGATEICDNKDNDCDNYYDEEDPGIDESTMQTYYIDQDGDSYGTDDSSFRDCDADEYGNAVLDGGDCNDDEEDINPGAVEVCNDIDDDCDGEVDLNAVDGSEYYPDADADGYGDDSGAVLLCDVRDGYAEEGGDCDDTDDAVNPGADEACFNDIDDNCDGEIDAACPTEWCGDITEDTTWTYDSYGYYVACDVSVLADLTIEPGTTVYFAPGKQMDVGVEGEGALIIDAASDPVTFQSGSAILYPTHELGQGEWVGVIFGELTNTYTTMLDGLAVWQAGYEGAEGGVVMDGIDLAFSNGAVCMSGTHGLVALGGASPEVTDSTLCDNVKSGFYADDDSGPADFSGNTLSGNTDFPISVLFRYGDAMDASNTYEDHDLEYQYIELREDIVESSVTLEAQGYPFYVSGDVQIYGTGVPKLTLEDGVSMAWAYGAGLQIGARSSPGDFTVNGSGDGVVLTAYEVARGWDGITVEQGSDVVQITGLDVSYGGNNNYANLYFVSGSSGLEATVENSVFNHSFKHGMYIGTAATPEISGSTFAHNTSYGLYIYDSSSSEGGLYVGSDPSFVSNTLTDNASPIQVPASYVDQLDNTSSFSGNTEDFVVVTGSTVSRNGTWQAHDVDYSITGDVSVEGTSSPVLTIAGGVTMYMADGVAFEVGDGSSGGLKTSGSSTSEVTMTSASDTPGPGDWDGLEFGSYTLSSSSLKGLAVEYAGGNGKGGIYVKRSDPAFESCRSYGNSNAGIYVEGSATDTPEPSFASCVISDNEDDGLYVDSNSGLSDFSSNEFSGNGGYPVSVNADYAGALDTASTYTDTGDEMVRVLGSSLSEDSTWRNLDADWFVPTDITISADLAISSGATVLFDGGASFQVGALSNGSLTATGTSSSHITFTSASEDPASGDWDGISLKSKCDASSFTYVDISYGAYGLYLDCSDAITVKNSTFTDAGTYDLYCSSRATSVSWSSVTYDTRSGCSF